ncbi:MAG: hypothetical protein IT289_09730 [Oligoflexia bacterium]|nr:hypothetical protein [Oligoflexia bacterium]
MKSFLIIILFIFSAATTLGAPKYGSQSEPLSLASTKNIPNAQSDFWRTIGYYTSQQTDSACSIAAATTAINVIINQQKKMSSDDELFTQDSLLKKVGNSKWQRSVSRFGRGVELADLKGYLQTALQKTELVNFNVELIYGDEIKTLEDLKQILETNDIDSKDVVIANFLQSTLTEDAAVGHYAVIGAFNKKEGQVLILDPDRKWYEPYWTPVSKLYESIKTRDSSSGKSRGLLWIKPKKS